MLVLQGLGRRGEGEGRDPRSGRPAPVHFPSLGDRPRGLRPLRWAALTGCMSPGAASPVTAK